MREWHVHLPIDFKRDILIYKKMAAKKKWQPKKNENSHGELSFIIYLIIFHFTVYFIKE